MLFDPPFDRQAPVLEHVLGVFVSTIVGGDLEHAHQVTPIATREVRETPRVAASVIVVLGGKEPIA